MSNETNIEKVYDLSVVTFLLNSHIYRLILTFSMGRKLKRNVIRWFNEMNTLTVTERVNYILDNKYEEEFFRLWFCISNIFVFLRSRFYEKSQFLIRREEKNKMLKEKVMLGIAFEEQNNLHTFYFSYIFLKNVLTRAGFFLSRLFLYAYFIFAIIFNIWTKIIWILMSLLVLCKALYKFDIQLSLKKAMIMAITILIILNIIDY